MAEADKKMSLLKIGSTVVQTPTGYFAVMHWCVPGQTGVAAIGEAIGEPIGPFETLESAKEAGSKALTIGAAAMKKMGIVSGRVQ